MEHNISKLLHFGTAYGVFLFIHFFYLVLNRRLNHIFPFISATSCNKLLEWQQPHFSGHLRCQIFNDSHNVEGKNLAPPQRRRSRKEATRLKKQSLEVKYCSTKKSCHRTTHIHERSNSQKEEEGDGKKKLMTLTRDFLIFNRKQSLLPSQKAQGFFQFYQYVNSRIPRLYSNLVCS